MDANYQKVIAAIKAKAKEILPQGSEITLFGSRARNTAREDSDWDILILTNDTSGKEETFNKYGFPFCEIGWYLDADINPLIYSKNEWDSQKHTYFYHTVMKDAIKIYS